MVLIIRFFPGIQSHEKNHKDYGSRTHKDPCTDPVIQDTTRQKPDNARSASQTAGIALDSPLKFFIDGLRDQRKQAWQYDTKTECTDKINRKDRIE